MTDLTERAPHLSRRVVWDRTATIIAVVLGCITVAALAVSSRLHSGVQSVILLLELPYVLGLAWVLFLVRDLRRRRVRAPLLAVPLVLVLLIVAGRTDGASRLRWELSRPAIEASVASLPAPPPRLSRELGESEIESYDTTFPGRCPSWLGSYRIVGCTTLPGGYVFLTSAPTNDWGEGGAGLVYLPIEDPESRRWSLDVLPEASSWPIDETWWAFVHSW